MPTFTVQSSQKLIKSRRALYRIDDANMCNLILIIRALCKQFGTSGFNTVVW